MEDLEPVQTPKIKPLCAVTGVLPAHAIAGSLEICTPIQRILTLHSGSLRELLFCLPALKTLRETFEGAHIGAVVRGGLAPLLESTNLVNEIFIRPEGGLSSQASLMAKLHAHKSDMAIAFSASRKSTLLAWSSGASVRIGFADASMEALFTHRVEKNSAAPLDIESCLDLARAAGCAPRCYDYGDVLKVPPHLLRDADSLLAEYSIPGEFLIVAPQSETRLSREEQSRNLARWLGVSGVLASRWPLVFIGAKANKILVPATNNSQNAICDLGGKLDPVMMAAICARAKLFVGHAGGNSHLAAALSISVVAICPSNEPRDIHEPRGVVHRTLEFDCAAELVVQAARELIGV